ncbi:DUF2804 domain-containing protein [Leptospira fluminis]|uniref:DUF2804 domain-containing protein n=1 Tax=Leptospira fluminis TaxID=2484979 RepID=A0A4R9GN87_9LEPT|nr:DUF2804 domain-containing protein [Leptospira fluminis]TGK17961.1 DUF2804 domain-containing protein [Leptospira fluminis]
MNLETEIHQQSVLCESRGKLNLNAVGWSKIPLHRCNLSRHLLRKKKWNYWCFYDQDLLVSFTVSDLDYAGVVFCYWWDRKTGEFEENTVITPFGSGCSLGQTVSNTALFQGENGKFSFSVDDYGSYRIFIDFHKENRKYIRAELKVGVPQNWETLNVVVPWSRNRFQYTHKLFGLGVEGSVKIGDKSYEFENDNSFAVLDFGRGVWPYSTKWNWASMSYRPNKKEVYGVNLGAGWTDGTGTTENALLINGRIYKVPSDVVFEFDRQDHRSPWRIYTKDSKAVELTLRPSLHRKAASNLGLISSTVHQMVGEFEGVLRVGKNEFLIEGGLGWAEDHRARW